jgi:3-(3-hydroxy-phenyl)propionate hydroxylase
MMPPFAGQGLNSGLRDAANLAWKIAAVESGQLERSVLGTYESERRPDAEATIRYSVMRGRVMMTTSRVQAALRDGIALAARSVGSLRRRLDGLPPKPYARYRAGFVVATDGGNDIAGAMLPQPKMLLADGTTVPLDELLGGWFSLIGVELDGSALERLRSDVWERLGARRIELALGERYPEGASIADAEGALSSMLAPYRGQIVVVRPDRFVLGAFDPDQEQSFIDRWRSIGLARTAMPTPEALIEAEPARSIR